jgi:hypothetical protein
MKLSIVTGCVSTFIKATDVKLGAENFEYRCKQNKGKIEIEYLHSKDLLLEHLEVDESFIKASDTSYGGIDCIEDVANIYAGATRIFNTPDQNKAKEKFSSVIVVANSLN